MPKQPMYVWTLWSHDDFEMLPTLDFLFGVNKPSVEDVEAALKSVFSSDICDGAGISWTKTAATLWAHNCVSHVDAARMPEPYEDYALRLLKLEMGKEVNVTEI